MRQKARLFTAMFCVTVLSCCGAAAQPPDKQDEGRKIIDRYAALLEKEASRLKPRNEHAFSVVMQAVNALREGEFTPDDNVAAPTKPLRTTRRAKVDNSFDPRQVKMTSVPIEVFVEKHASAFPVQNNLAGTGIAEASSTYPDVESPDATLGGVRRRDIWCLHGPTGTYTVHWDDPVSGRYILLFARPGAVGQKNDRWGKATVQINDQPAMGIDEMGSGQVMAVDLGKAVVIRSLIITFNGTGNPGLCGVEVHGAEQNSDEH